MTLIINRTGIVYVYVWTYQPHPGIQNLRNKYIYIYNNWLVVQPPLWKIFFRHLGWWNMMNFPTEWDNRIHGNQTTNQINMIQTTPFKTNASHKPQRRKPAASAAATSICSRSKAIAAWKQWGIQPAKVSYLLVHLYIYILMIKKIIIVIIIILNK